MDSGRGRVGGIVVVITVLATRKVPRCCLSQHAGAVKVQATHAKRTKIHTCTSGESVLPAMSTRRLGSDLPSLEGLRGLSGNCSARLTATKKCGIGLNLAS